MTLTTNARIAGITFFVYLAAGISSLVFAGRAAADVFAVFESFSALVLGVTFYAITRDVDRDVALVALACRVIEAVPGNGLIYFAVGNALFCGLLVRGRLIPRALAWFGVVASSFLVVLILSQRAGFLGSTRWSSYATWLAWLPVLISQLTLAVWLLTRGVAASADALPTMRARVPESTPV
jgi:hypothetical protein